MNASDILSAIRGIIGDAASLAARIDVILGEPAVAECFMPDEAGSDVGEYIVRQLTDLRDSLDIAAAGLEGELTPGRPRLAEWDVCVIA